MHAMEEIVEEILKTEGDCAQRLTEERKVMEKRRAEIQAENAERVRTYREQAEDRAAELLREHRDQVHRSTEEEIRNARNAAEGDLAANQAVLDRIVDRIVDLVTGADRG